MSPSRRGFLGWLGSSSLAGVGLSRVARADPGSTRDRTGMPHHDKHARSIAETWDMSWTDRITGKYRAVFDSPGASDGAAFYRAVSWIEQYKEVYGAEPAAMSAVVVLRHLGFYLAMNDEFWAAHDVGKELKMRNARGKKWARINPVGPAAATDEASRKFTLAGFQALGGIVLACGWSFRGAAAQVAKKEKLEGEAARTRMRALLLPGVILQPNGVFGALRAQEAGCHYIDAS